MKHTVRPDSGSPAPSAAPRRSEAGAPPDPEAASTDGSLRRADRTGADATPCDRAGRSPRAARPGLRMWVWAHKWSSLVCTVFMLLLCLTGLPLVFHHQIAHALGNVVEPPELPASASRVSLDRVLETARARWPDKAVQFVSKDLDDDRAWYVTLSDRVDQPAGLKQVAVDARTGDVLNEPPLDSGFLQVMLALHTDLYAGLPGKLFLGAMGLLLLVSLVSGTVLYAPFMRKLAFGEVRRTRSTRTRWLDLHNLLGIVALVWTLVVGATGVVNTWVDLAVGYWRADQLAEMVAPYRGRPPVATPGSLQTAVDAALAREPGMGVKFIAFPGTAFTSPHHYGVYLHGAEPLTSRLHRPVLVDATTGAVTASRPVPWYLTVLLLAQPLHFGDYGGLPLQILWAALDLVTIVVLGSGIYLWLVRHGPGRTPPRASGPATGPPRGPGRLRRSTWAVPIGLGLASGCGLVAGLLGDGAWDVVAWAGLAVPTLTGIGYALRRRGGP